MKIKHLLFAGLTAFAAGSALTGIAAQNKTLRKEADWASVEYPSDWSSGDVLEVKVTPKAAIGKGMSVICELHWMKKDGYGGYLSWTAPVPAKAGETIVFKHKPTSKAGMSKIDAMCYYAPTDSFSFDNAISRIHCEVIAHEAGTGETAGKDPGIAAAKPLYPDPPQGITWKKSSIWFVGSNGPVANGDKVEATFGYYLDPSETWGDKPTSIMCMPLGPWIDNPDGQANKNRMHVNYGSLNVQHKEVKPGEGQITYTWALKDAQRYNSLFFLCQFKRPDGRAWPWDWRGGHLEIVRPNEKFNIVAAADGGMFFGDEIPAVNFVWGKNRTTEPRQVEITLRNISGKEVLTRTVLVDPKKNTHRIELDGIAERGTFSVSADIPGFGSDYCYVATAPVFKRRHKEPTPFGCTDVSSPSRSELAAKLGFSYVRHFKGWAGFESRRGQYTLDGIELVVNANVNAGLRPWISLQGAPSWALPDGMHGFGYEPAPVDMRAWGAVITEVSKRLKGKLHGWEWLNEIVPGGKCEDPVATYLEMCRVGTRAAKSVDPNLEIQLAGGLWPHNFRIDLLNSGVQEYIDVLPVHYATFASIDEARRDLAARAAGHVAVIDNETASGMSTWNMDPAQTLEKSVGQCRHVMERWPDVLSAGASRVVYFGGQPNPAGNWTYLLDDTTPRPVAVTLAVVQGKLAYAKPVGKFYLGEAEINLFESPEGESIVFLKVAGKSGVSVELPAKKALTVTDYQGNERDVEGKTIDAGEMPVIVEGTDLDALKMHVAASVGRSTIPAPVPQHVAEAGDTIHVPVRLHNAYSSKKEFTLTPSAVGWGTAEPCTVSLEAGESRFIELAFIRKEGAELPSTTDMLLNVASSGLQTVQKPFMLYITDDSTIGNLLKNGDFEDGLSNWSGNGLCVKDPEVPENHVLKLPGTGNWAQTYQSVNIPVPGQTYLYTAWVWSRGMDSGSNMGTVNKDGTKRDYYMPDVFSTGATGTSYWRFFAKRVNTTDQIESVHFQPVGKGGSENWTLYDNLMVTLYRGTDHVAFAVRDDIDKSSPIPLLCDNQIKVEKGYNWTPDNLSGRATFAWDDKALLFKVVVVDDKFVTSPVVSGSGEETLRGDAVALSIFPRMGIDRLENDQLRWYISNAGPGGGSGEYTIFRPAKYSLGVKSGHLAKDSSLYSLDITRDGTRTTYMLRIPWEEIPGFSPAKGATFGCSIELIDCDAPGGPVGRMLWGGGLRETPGDCGLVTLLP